jgi:hypothetical protein
LRRRNGRLTLRSASRRPAGRVIAALRRRSRWHPAGRHARARRRGAPPHLVVDPAYVLADQAEREELHAAEEQDDDGRGREARNRPVGEEPQVEHEQDAEKAHRGGADAEQRPEAQGEVAEPDDAVERQVHEPPEGVLGGAAGARIAVVRERGLAKAGPRAQPAHEPVALAHAHHDVGHAAIHQAEVAAVERNVEPRQHPQQPVEQLIGDALDPGLLTRAAHRVDHVPPLAPHPDELGHQLRRILQVAVHDDHGVARRVLEPGADRHLMPEVARQPDDLQAGVAAVCLAQRLERPIGAAVVDQNRFPGADAGAVQRPRQSLDELWHDLLLVVNRHHDREPRQRPAIARHHRLVTADRRRPPNPSATTSTARVSSSTKAPPRSPENTRLATSRWSKRKPVGCE